MSFDDFTAEMKGVEGGPQGDSLVQELMGEIRRMKIDREEREIQHQEQMKRQQEHFQQQMMQQQGQGLYGGGGGSMPPQPSSMMPAPAPAGDPASHADEMQRYLSRWTGKIRVYLSCKVGVTWEKDPIEWNWG